MSSTFCLEELLSLSLCHYVTIPRTHLTSVLLGKYHIWGGWWSKTEVIQVLARYVMVLLGRIAALDCLGSSGVNVSRFARVNEKSEPETVGTFMIINDSMIQIRNSNIDS